MPEHAQSDERCTCSPNLYPGGYSKGCPWARSFNGGEPLGHVKDCPVSGEPCPCLPGSTAHAYCIADARRKVT